MIANANFRLILPTKQAIFYYLVYIATRF